MWTGLKGFRIKGQAEDFTKNVYVPMACLWLSLPAQTETPTLVLGIVADIKITDKAIPSFFELNALNALCWLEEVCQKENS